MIFFVDLDKPRDKESIPDNNASYNSQIQEQNYRKRNTINNSQKNQNLFFELLQFEKAKLLKKYIPNAAYNILRKHCSGILRFGLVWVYA